MNKIAADSKNDFSADNYFWSSSEVSDNSARYWFWDMKYGDDVSCYWNRKDFNYFWVRPVLAF